MQANKWRAKMLAGVAAFSTVAAIGVGVVVATRSGADASERPTALLPVFVGDPGRSAHKSGRGSVAANLPDFAGAINSPTVYGKPSVPAASSPPGGSIDRPLYSLKDVKAPRGGTPTTPKTEPLPPGENKNSLGNNPHDPTTNPAVVLSGFSWVPSNWATSVHTIQVGAMSRIYVTVMPAEPTGPLPVVVLMHGRSMTPGQMLRLTNMTAEGPAIFIVPQGFEQEWNSGDCCGAAYLKGVDDVGFIQDALQQVLQGSSFADGAHIYAAGFSNGGRMAYQLACHLPGEFAGFAASEAVPVESCPSMAPLDIAIMANQDDPLLSVGVNDPPKSIDGFLEPTVSATVSRYRQLNGCTTQGTYTTEGQAQVHMWSCAGNHQLTYVLYPNGGHGWRPRTGITPGDTDFLLRLMGRVSQIPVPLPSSSLPGVSVPPASKPSGSTTTTLPPSPTTTTTRPAAPATTMAPPTGIARSRPG